MQFSVYGCMLLISWFGAKAVVACGGDAALGLSTGELTSLFTYTMQILSSLMMLSMVFVMIVISRASMERIDEVLQEKSAIVSPENAVTAVTDGSIVFDDVTFRYNARAEKPRAGPCESEHRLRADRRHPWAAQVPPSQAWCS